MSSLDWNTEFDTQGSATADKNSESAQGEGEGNFDRDILDNFPDIHDAVSAAVEG